MNESVFKDKVARLKEVGKIIEQLPEEIRVLSFSLLEPYITGTESSPIQNGSSISKKITSKSNSESTDYSSRDEFLASFDHAKPSDNVRLIIASLYKDYGTEPFSLEELSTIATNTGVTIPERIDMTIKSAQHKGKSLFIPTSRGFYKPTVHGEQYLREIYKITKGTNKREVE